MSSLQQASGQGRPDSRILAAMLDSFDLAEMLRLINEERVSRGMHPLTRDRALDHVAYIQTAWVIWEHDSQLSHEGHGGVFVDGRLREKGIALRSAWIGRLGISR